MIYLYFILFILRYIFIEENTSANTITKVELILSKLTLTSFIFFLRFVAIKTTLIITTVTFFFPLNPEEDH